MKKIKFKIYHAMLQFLMDWIMKIRFQLRADSKMEIRLANLHLLLLNKQMAARKKAGIQEIECHVEWRAW